MWPCAATVHCITPQTYLDTPHASAHVALNGLHRCECNDGTTLTGTSRIHRQLLSDPSHICLVSRFGSNDQSAPGHQTWEAPHCRFDPHP